MSTLRRLFIGMDEFSLPLNVNLWPTVSASETSVNIEYEAFEMFDLRNVLISIPLPASREPPSVRQIDGEWRYDAMNSSLEWSILLIDNTNAVDQWSLLCLLLTLLHSSPLRSSLLLQTRTTPYWPISNGWLIQSKLLASPLEERLLGSSLQLRLPVSLPQQLEA